MQGLLSQSEKVQQGLVLGQSPDAVAPLEFRGAEQHRENSEHLREDRHRMVVKAWSDGIPDHGIFPTVSSSTYSAYVTHLQHLLILRCSGFSVSGLF